MTLNIQLLETSFNKVKDNAVEFSASFYSHLFAHHPELKPFYEWLDLYGESSPEIQKLIANTTHFKYRNYKAPH